MISTAQYLMHHFFMRKSFKDFMARSTTGLTATQVRGPASTAARALSRRDGRAMWRLVARWSAPPACFWPPKWRSTSTAQTPWSRPPSRPGAGRRPSRRGRSATPLPAPPATRRLRRRRQESEHARNRLFAYERKVLNALGFEVNVEHPYQHLVSLAQEMNCAGAARRRRRRCADGLPSPPPSGSREVGSTAWSILNDR